jgi:hypothetical protein
MLFHYLPVLRQLLLQGEYHLHLMLLQLLAPVFQLHQAKHPLHQTPTQKVVLL